MNSHNTEEPSKYNMYLAAKDLYGWDMSQYLPTGGFKWFSEKAFNAVNLAEYTEVGGKKDRFLKLIWSIHVNDMIVIMTTNLPLKNMCF